MEAEGPLGHVLGTTGPVGSVDGFEVYNGLIVREDDEIESDGERPGTWCCVVG